MVSRWTSAVAFLLAIATPGNAFVSQSNSPLVSKPVTSTSSALSMGPPADPSAPITEQYGEGSRKYRRTVYTHDQWVKHRSPDRFLNNIRTLVNSGIYKQVAKEVIATTSVAVFVCGWNALAGGYEGFDGSMHEAVIQGSWVQKVGLPLTPFTVLTPSLGLLLGEIPSLQKLSFIIYVCHYDSIRNADPSHSD